MRGLFRRDDGAVTVFFIFLVPLLVGIWALAADYTRLTEQQNFVQGVADVAAVAGVRKQGGAADVRRAVRATVAENTRYPIATLADSDIILGKIQNREFVANADQNSMAQVTAVKVVLHSPARFTLLSFVVPDNNMQISRMAVAQIRPRVSFSLSSCLLQVTLLNSLLRPLLGAGLDVFCKDDLIAARITLSGLMSNLAEQAKMPADSTYGDVLGARIDAGKIMTAALGVKIADTGYLVRLQDAMYLPSEISSLPLSNLSPSPTVTQQEVVLVAARLMGVQIPEINQSLSLGGIQAAVKLRLANGGQTIIGATPGDPNAVARTSQMSLQIGPINVLNVINLSFSLNLASATAALTNRGNACATNASDIIALFDPVTVTPFDMRLDIKALGLPISFDTAASKSRLFNSSLVTSAAFTVSEYLSRKPRVFGPTSETEIGLTLNNLMAAVSGATKDAKSAVETQKNTIKCSGLLDCLVGGITYTLLNLVNSVLSNLSQAITQLDASSGSVGVLVKNILSDLLRLKVGTAELRLLDVTCGDSARLAQ